MKEGAEIELRSPDTPAKDLMKEAHPAFCEVGRAAASSEGDMIFERRYCSYELVEEEGWK